ncbi:MAG: ATPase, partial [Bacilli bacterium]
GAYLENIVYNELISRGYSVFVGTMNDSEIDFIATKYEEKIYVQVAYILSNDDVVNREFNAFNIIEDNFPKYVLTMDKFDFSKNGIIHKNIIDWLLDI